MDGVAGHWEGDAEPRVQATIGSAIGCVGVGLHSGRRVRLEFQPAPPGTGIVFRRTDLSVDIPARHEFVCDTRLCTQLGLPEKPEARVGTVEHVLAALSAAGIDNAVVAVDGPELPVLDGSSSPFLFLLDCAGRAVQDAPRDVIEIVRPVRVGDEHAFAELRPGGPGFDMTLGIDFAAAAIGCQALSIRLTGKSFRRELQWARTFTLKEEIDGLRAAGLARGGSLENAVVVDGNRVLNPGGLRRADEFVRHKLLDAVGDLTLAGAPIWGRFIGRRSGHALNVRLLRALFASSANWRWAPGAWNSNWAVPAAKAA